KGDAAEADKEGRCNRVLFLMRLAMQGSGTKTDEKLPPHNRDAERSMLGCMLRDPNSVADALGLVHQSEYYVVAHSIIHGNISRLHDVGTPIDIVTVGAAINESKLMDDVGGGYLADLWDAAPAAANYPQYAEIIRAHSRRRQLAQLALDLKS